MTFGNMQLQDLFGEKNYTRKASIVETEENLSNLLKNPAKFNKKYRPITNEGKEKNRDTYEGFVSSL